MMGVQLAALLLAGRGAAWSARAIWHALRSSDAQPRSRVAARGRRQRTRVARRSPLAAAIVVLAPAWLQLRAYDRHNAAAITAQRRADATQGAQLDRLIALIEHAGGGRVYAGMPSNWGMDFTVGAVPVFKYLESRDVDEVGYTLRTASLMTDPEYFFDERDPGDYQLFGIRYLIVPSGYPRPYRPSSCCEPARTPCGRSALPVTSRSVRVVGRLTANRTDVGGEASASCTPGFAQEGDYLRVAFGQSGGAVRPLPAEPAQPSAGTVIAESRPSGPGRSERHRQNARARSGRAERLL